MYEERDLTMTLVEVCALPNALKIKLEGDILVVIIHSKFNKNILLISFYFILLINLFLFILSRDRQTDTLFSNFWYLMISLK